jgi:hypothetical protein
VPGLLCQLCPRLHSLATGPPGLGPIRGLFSSSHADSLARTLAEQASWPSGPEVALCPSDLTALNNSHHRPPLCHPERTRISYFTALPEATYAALRRESRMQSTEATVLGQEIWDSRGICGAP